MHVKGIGRLVASGRNRLFNPFRKLIRFRPAIICINQGAAYDCVTLPGMQRLNDWLLQCGVPCIYANHGNLEWQVPDDGARGLARRLFCRASKVGFMSMRNVALAERQLAADLPNAIVMRNPVNISDRSIVPWPQNGPWRFAHVARLDSGIKAHDLLFECLSANSWKGRDWRLRIAGEGPSLSYLHELCNYYGLQSHIDFLGHQQDIRSLWSDNHVLVLPSRTESAPLAIVEAMLCGRIAVATDVGGVKEWVDDGRTGFIASAPTVTSFAEALERAWDARASWQSMGELAHEVVETRVEPEPGRTLLDTMLETLSIGGSNAHQP